MATESNSPNISSNPKKMENEKMEHKKMEDKNKEENIKDKTCPQIPIMPAEPRLANAYVPFQYYTELFPPDKGLDRGTIFPGLFRPYGLDPEYLINM